MGWGKGDSGLGKVEAASDRVLQESNVTPVLTHPKYVFTAVVTL